MVHALKPDFVFRRNGRVQLNRQGPQFSRILAADVCASAVVMLDIPCSEVVWRVLTTHYVRQFPLPGCVAVCHHISTGVYQPNMNLVWEECVWKIWRTQSLTLVTWACLMGIQPADSAGRRQKQCNILFAAARCWLVSATKFLGICLSNQKNKHSPSKRPLPLHKRHRAAESELNEDLRVAQ
jgi:hypothetical protein